MKEIRKFLKKLFKREKYYMVITRHLVYDSINVHYEKSDSLIGCLGFYYPMERITTVRQIHKRIWKQNQC